MNTLTNLNESTLGELMQRSFPPREDVLQPWLRSEETCILWADTGVGKTMFSLSLAIAVAGGGTLGNWSAPKARKVLYVDGEMNIRDLHERFQFLITDANIVSTSEQRQTAYRSLTVTVRQDQALGSDFYDLSQKDHQAVLAGKIAKDGYELVILDNFTTLSDSIEDENASTSFKQIQSFFLELKRKGIASILVHHSNKTGKAMRGSSSLAATFEVIIGLSKPQIVKAGQASFVLTFDKFRSKGDSTLEPQTWTLDDGR